MPRPRLPAYPRETVVAEKLETMVKLGLANSRMKDFFDVALLARLFSFRGSVLQSAIAATFERRGESIPTGLPIALTEAFATDKQKQQQWRSFTSRIGSREPVGDLEETITLLATFLGPPLASASRSEAFSRSWTVNGNWEEVIDRSSAE